MNFRFSSFRAPNFRGSTLPGQSLLAAAAFALPLLWTGFARAQVPGSPPVGPVVREAVEHDVSPPLREIPPRLPAPGPPRIHEHEILPTPRGTGASDPAVQSETFLSAAAPALLSTFEGGGKGIATYTVDAAPPDTNGDVGPNHYVQWLNEQFTVFSKAGAILYGPAAGNTLWTGFPTTGGNRCATNNDGDPIVQYDQLADRWVMTQFDVTGGPPYFQCFAVSTTPDPTGTYNRYAFSFTNFNDYPKIGVWPDGYYATFNMYNGNSFVGGEACVFDRAKMLAGAAATAQCMAPDANLGGGLPSDLDGSTPPPAGSPGYFLAFGTNDLLFWKLHVDWANPANTAFTGPTTIAVATFNPACAGGTCIVQSGTRQKLDSLADRLMYRLAYRNFGDHEALVVNHSVTPGTTGTGLSGIRWYELRLPAGVPTLFQQGTYAPADGIARWMGSIAMDKDGNIAVGYSESSSSIHPGIAFTGRLAGDVAGTLGTETNMTTGGGSQTKNLNRWGDYSSMSVDPVDDCTFWYTNEYLAANGTFNWQTRIGSFKFPTCGNCTTFPTAVASGSTTICAGQSTPLSGSGGVSCSWSPTTGLSNAGSCTPSASPSATTTYTLTVTDANGCSSTNAPTVRVTVNPKPSPTISPSGSTTFCQGGSVTLDAGAGYSSYLWSPGGATTRTINVTTSGSYAVTVTNSSGCSGTSSSLSVTVNALPTAAASGSATICAGSSTSLSGSGGVSCSWSPSTGLSNASSCTPSASPSSTTTYALTVTSSAGCVSTNSPIVTVTVNPRPTAAASGSATICAGQSTALSGSGGVSCSWSPATGLSNASSCAPSASPSSTTTYTLTVTGANGCSSTNAPTATVTVNPIPATPAITAPSNANPGDSGLIASVVNHAGSTYAWTIVNGTIDGGNGTNQITFTAGAAGTLTLQVVETNSNGCSSAAGSTTVNVGSTPSPLSFYTLTPCRVVDTRNPDGPYGGPSIDAGQSRDFVLTGQCGIAADAKSVSVNVTVVFPTGAGELTAYPTGVASPVASTISYPAGRLLANNSLFTLGTGGSVTIENHQTTGTAEIVIDTNGYFK